MPDLVLLAITAACALLAGCWIGHLREKRAHRAISRQLEQLLEHSRLEARTDPLTGLWNRRAFDEQLVLQSAIARRYATPLTLAVIDADQLKAINDQSGHPSGDRALRQVADILRRTVRESDFAARLGGDEFAILFVQTDSQGAIAAAERCAQRVAQAELPDASSPVPLRISIGLAEFDPAEPLAGFMERADQALYQSKRSGRGTIHLHNGRFVVACPQNSQSAVEPRDC